MLVTSMIICGFAAIVCTSLLSAAVCCCVWIRVDGRPFTATTRELDFGVLEFASVTGSESGQYICTATNIAGTSNVTIDVNVRGTHCTFDVLTVFLSSSVVKVGAESPPLSLTLSLPSLPLSDDSLLLRKPAKGQEKHYKRAYCKSGFMVSGAMGKIFRLCPLSDGPSDDSFQLFFAFLSLVPPPLVPWTAAPVA